MRSLFLLLVRSLLALGLWCAAAPAIAQERIITQALFARSEQGPWQAVTLPDTWAARGLKGSGRGVYRTSFELDAAPEGLWALRMQRLSTHHRVHLNGQLVSGSMPTDNIVQRRPTPVLITLPPSLLRAGTNQIEIEVDNGVRAGLSPLELGPAAAVEQEFVTGYHLGIALPQMLNVASGGVCLLTLLLWWRRRSEVALGTFAVLGLLTSVRNLGYYRVSTVWPAAFTDWLYFAAQVVSAMLLGLFAMALSGRRPRGFRPTLLWGGAALLLIGAIAAPQHGMNQVRAVAYPFLLGVTVPSLWLVWLRAREMRTSALVALLAALTFVFGAGVHDYFYQQGHTSVMDAYWLPYAVPVALVAFAGVLVQRIVGALHQVEELNQTLEQRVRERTHDLQIANTAKTRFLAAASHDLRQPVVTIGLLVGLLREQIAEPALRAMVGKVDEAVASMESLLAGLLDLSRLDSGTLRPRVQRVALQPMFDAIAAHEAEAARRKGLALRLRPTALAVHSDPLLLEQILRNFVSNAVRYTDAGGVLLAARVRRGRVLLQVWDTGRGIAADQQDAVFEEFVQLDNPQRDRSQGLGLGLAIVRRSAALLGARPMLASRPGRGSCFGLAVPLAGSGAPLTTEPELVEPLLAGQTVVLVEDDAAVREAMTARLSAWGAGVMAFAAPHALRVALDALPTHERRASLIITDQRLPGGSGLDVIELARRRFGALPALVVTGNTSPHEIAQLSASGARVLHKPFRAEELLGAIRALLQPR
jgi:signal transduction histidine kinase/CheY-like chemotaxis protein